MRTIFFSVFLLMNSLLLAQEPQSEFRPVTEIPASEQLPSVPLVIAAYAFVWAAFLVYAWTMWRKLSKVEEELTTLSAQMSKPRAAGRNEGVHP
jgi:CcmD family protein